MRRALPHTKTHLSSPAFRRERHAFARIPEPPRMPWRIRHAANRGKPFRPRHESCEFFPCFVGAGQIGGRPVRDLDIHHPANAASGGVEAFPDIIKKEMPHAGRREITDGVHQISRPYRGAFHALWRLITVI